MNAFISHVNTVTNSRKVVAKQQQLIVEALDRVFHLFQFSSELSHVNFKFRCRPGKRKTIDTAETSILKLAKKLSLRVLSVKTAKIQFRKFKNFGRRLFEVEQNLPDSTLKSISHKILRLDETISSLF